MKRQRHSWWVVIPTIFFATMVVLGARAHTLWQDEAETAIYARSILHSGVPKGWDGVNLEGSFQDGTVILNERLTNHVSPWVQYYLAAASFWIFGESSFTARLPFLLIGIATIPLSWWFSVTLTGRRSVALVSTVFLSLSVQYILYGFQARHYIVSVVAGLLFLIAAFRLHARRARFLFVASGALFLMNNYIMFPLFYLSTLAAMVVFQRCIGRSSDSIARFVRTSLALGVFIAVLATPWFLLNRPFSDVAGVEIPPLDVFADALADAAWTTAVSFHLSNVFPLGMVLLSAIVFLGDRLRRRPLFPAIGFLGVFLTVYAAGVIVMDALTLVGNNTVVVASNRYHVVLIPLFVIVVSLLVNRFWAWRRVAGATIGVLFLSGALMVVSPRFYLFEYLWEIFHSYQTPDEAVAAYLEQHAQTGDTVFVSLDRAHEPLVFLLKEKVRFVNRIHPLHPLLFTSVGRRLPRYLSTFTGAPDWVVLYSKRGRAESFLTSDYRGAFPQGLTSAVDLARDYDEVALPVFFADQSRPELPFHAFRATTPSDDDRVFVYRKKQGS